MRKWNKMFDSCGETQDQEENLQRKNEELQKQNEALRAELKALQENVAGLEKELRESDQGGKPVSEQVDIPEPAEQPKPVEQPKPEQSEPASQPKQDAQPAPEPKPASNQQPTRDDKTLEELKTMLAGIEKRISALNVGGSARNADEKCQQWQDKYNKLYQNVQEDTYRKDKVKLAGRMIHHVDLLRRMLYDFNANRPADKAKDDETQFLEKQIELIISAMDDTLRHEMIMTRPMAKAGDELNDEMMEIIDTVDTDQPNLDGRVFRSVSACYYWTLPYILKARLDEKGDEVRHYNFMIHPEEVIVYKLKKQ